jgi:hypothetical protein
MRPWRISRFQFSVIVVVTIVALIGFASLRDLQERLEQAQVEATVRNLNSALQYEVAHRIAGGQENRIVELAGANPVPWLQAPLPGYLGEVAVAPSETTRGSWFFDRSRGELVYRPVLSRHLEGAGSPPVLKWRIQRSQRPGRLALTGGLSLVASVDYRWY